MRFVPATLDRIYQYYGVALPVTIRGFVVLNDDDEAVGVTGFIRKKKNTMVIFSEGKPEAYADKRMVVKLTRKMMRIADVNGWTLIADQDKTLETSQHFLERLGFEPDDEGVYTRWPCNSSPL